MLLRGAAGEPRPAHAPVRALARADDPGECGGSLSLGGGLHISSTWATPASIFVVSQGDFGTSHKQLCWGKGAAQPSPAPIPSLMRMKQGSDCNPPAAEANHSSSLLREEMPLRVPLAPYKQNKTNPSYGFHLPFNAT